VRQQRSQKRGLRPSFLSKMEAEREAKTEAETEAEAEVEVAAVGVHPADSEGAAEAEAVCSGSVSGEGGAEEREGLGETGEAQPKRVRLQDPRAMLEMQTEACDPDNPSAPHTPSTPAADEVCVCVVCVCVCVFECV
jgi:hypothetical protein